MLRARPATRKAHEAHEDDRSGGLRLDHRDPFDRMLIAQAQMEDLPLITNETLFDAFGVTRIW